MAINPAAPTASVGAEQAVISSFVMFGGSQGARLTTAMVQMGDRGEMFRNLTLKINGVQVGATIAQPRNSEKCGFIMDVVAPPKRWAKVDVVADVAPDAPVGVEVPTVTLLSISGYNLVTFDEVKIFPVGGQLAVFASPPAH